MVKSFNTTLVQLKGPFALASSALAHGFNTTLVQLKGPLEACWSTASPWFQYHTGPIKSEADEAAPQGRRRVSIPHWSN